MMSTDTTKVTDRIMKLLTKAERTDNEAEAATFMAAAQRLMAQHAIAESMVRAAGRRAANEVETKTFATGRTWWRTDLALVGFITAANDCQYYGTMPGRRGGGHITLVGYAEDIANVEMIYVSLQVQLARFLRGTPSYQSWRRNFRLGFAVRAGERLAEARAHVVEEMAESDPSLLPMLVDKAATVKDAMPDGLSVTRTSGGGGAYGAGINAGNRADVGGPAMPSGARALA